MRLRNFGLNFVPDPTLRTQICSATTWRLWTNARQYQYIENNINNIDYAKYQQKGYFIGSGAIESGNRLVLQQRLKQPGMRWNEYTAQPLLTLRAKFESGLWEKDVVEILKRKY